MNLIDQAESGSAPPFIQYIYNCGVVLSQLGYCVLFAGDPDESISGATGKASLQGKRWYRHVQEPLINFIFQDKHHCYRSIELDEGKRGVFAFYDRPFDPSLLKRRR